MKCRSTVTAILIVSACLAVPVQAELVHKWVDADGVTHYSDDPPATDATQATSIEVPAPGSRTTHPQDDYYSIANQWQRMHRERLERDRIALEKAKVKAARENSRRESERRAQSETRYVVEKRGYAYPWYGHGHRPYKPVVVPRKYPPGLHPGRNLSQGGYHQ